MLNHLQDKKHAESDRGIAAKKFGFLHDYA
jgi:hypothetical protein